MSAKKAREPSSPEYTANLALYEKLVATNPAIERKGDTMPYTSVNGHMFSLLTKEGTLILRLAPHDQSAFLEKYESKVPVQYGAVMKEYVEVPDSLLSKTRELKKYFDRSYAYVSSLKPKLASKKK
jgi:TfoX/Sxy family transcriptional regulator of competence genes